MVTLFAPEVQLFRQFPASPVYTSDQSVLKNIRLHKFVFSVFVKVYRKGKVGQGVFICRLVRKKKTLK